MNIEAEDVLALEKLIDHLTRDLSRLKNFILGGRSPLRLRGASGVSVCAVPSAVMDVANHER